MEKIIILEPLQVLQNIQKWLYKNFNRNIFRSINVYNIIMVINVESYFELNNNKNLLHKISKCVCGIPTYCSRNDFHMHSAGQRIAGI